MRELNNGKKLGKSSLRGMISFIKGFLGGQIQVCLIMFVKYSDYIVVYNKCLKFGPHGYPKS